MGKTIQWKQGMYNQNNFTNALSSKPFSVWNSIFIYKQFQNIYLRS